MSFKQYRMIDLLLFLGMYALCEYLVVKAATVWFDEPYSISIMLPMLLIVMMRWSGYAVIHAVLYAVLFVLYQKGSAVQYLIYIAGNLGMLLALFYVEKVGKERIRHSFMGSVAYLVIGFLLMELFRGIASVVFAGSDIRIILQFLMSDMLSLVFGILVIVVIRGQDGLFEDQKHYLLRLDSQKEKEGGWQDE